MRDKFRRGAPSAHIQLIFRDMGKTFGGVGVKNGSSPNWGKIFVQLKKIFNLCKKKLSTFLKFIGFQLTYTISTKETRYIPAVLRAAMTFSHNMSTEAGHTAGLPPKKGFLLPLGSHPRHHRSQNLGGRPGTYSHRETNLMREHFLKHDHFWEIWE